MRNQHIHKKNHHAEYSSYQFIEQMDHNITKVKYSHIVNPALFFTGVNKNVNGRLFI